MSDRFRKTYKDLDETTKQKIHQIKQKATELEELYLEINDMRAPIREISLALTNLEQSVMWAIKGSTGV